MITTVRMFGLKIKYKTKYYWKAFWNGIGICHKCWERGNFTTRGRFICTNGNCK